MTLVENMDVDIDSEQERIRKADKKARKAAKKAKKESAKAAVAEVSQTEAADDIEQQELKKQRKAEKKLRKQQEAAAAGVVCVAPSPSTSSSSSSRLVASTHTGRTSYYVQHTAVAALNQTQVSTIRNQYKMQLSGDMKGHDSYFHPISEFSQAGFSSALLSCTAGFTAPTAIQAQAWPVLLNGRDCIAIAETGSGKTLAFVLPACVHISNSDPLSTHRKEKGIGNMGPIALIVAPTRELAMQTKEVADKVCAAVNMNVACIYGGVDRVQQRAALAKGVHLMVATPGRLLSLVNDGEVTLCRTTFLVLDEADRMLDMGFEPDIRAIVGMCPSSKTRQTLMFSATWPECIQKLAREFIVEPLRITIGKNETKPLDENGQEISGGSEILSANKRIKQSVEVIDEFKRDGRLLDLLREYHGSKHAKDNQKILIFVLYKKEVDKVERLIKNKGYNAVAMSSDKSQYERTAAIEAFKSDQTRILIATDVAGRGLDINNIDLVINYSFPLTVEDYVHRIGRTGRGGKDGNSITFFTKNDKHLSGELINLLNECKQPVPDDLMKFGTGVKRKVHGMYGNFYKPVDDNQPMKKAMKVKL